MDFALPPELEHLRQRTREFVAGAVLPVEADRSAWDEHENIRLDRLAGLRALAKTAGLWAPQTPRALGGMGLSRLGMAVMYQEANRSIFGPVVFNAAAPDDGNMMLLAAVGSEAQRDRWLAPIVDGSVRSAFAMTEPAPGGGSDPGMIRTRAERRDGRWVIEGRKWFITGAGVAQHFILIARTSDDARRGLSAFLFDRDQPGWAIVRRIPIMGPEEHGGHCELVFTGLEVADENVLMAVGDGLKVTQIRLGPARLTHCMRWLGLATRCLEIAQAYVDDRHAFGTRLRGPRERADQARPRGHGDRDRPAIGAQGRLDARSGRAGAHRRSRWPRCRSRTRCTSPPTLPSSSRVPAAIPRTRWRSGSTATRARHGWSTAPARSMRW